MSQDSKRPSFSESLVLDDSEKGVIVKGITDDTVAAKSGLQAGDEIVAATVHLDHLNKNEVLNILRALEPYDNNMKVLTKKELNASAGLGSLDLGLTDSSEILNLKKDLSLDASAETPAVFLDGLNGKLNTTKGLEGDISGPTLNGDLPSLSVKTPSADAGAKFTAPSLGLTGPCINEDRDGTLKVPDVSVSTPQLDTPSASLDINKPTIKTGNAKYKVPKFTMPHFSLPPLKTPGHSGDVDLPVSGNLETPDLNLEQKVDLNGPDAHLEIPNADIEPSSGKFKWPNITRKGLSTPGMDGDLDAPDIDINLPKAEIKGPDVDAQAPNLDIDAQSGKINWPHLKWKKPNLYGTNADMDLDANLNTTDVDLSVPKVKGGINAPDIDVNLPETDVNGPDLQLKTPNIDAEAPSGKINWPHLKWKKPKLQGPKADLDVDTHLNTPKIEGDIHVPNAELNLTKADLKGPGVDVPATTVDIDAPSGKINWPHLKWKKAKLNGPKADMDLNADLNTPDVDLSVPKADCEIGTPNVDLNLPKANVDINAPNADIEVPSSKTRFPTLKKPKFLLSGPKVKAPDTDLNVDADVKVPDLSLSAPKIDGDINAPDVNLDLPKVDLESPKLDVDAPDIEGPSGKFKWFNFKKPKFGTLKGPKAELDADMKVPDVNLSGPNIEGGIDAPNYSISMPDADIKSPDLDLNSPDLDLDPSTGKLKLPKLKLPKLKGPKVKGPELDVDLKEPDLDASVDLPKIEADAPNVDLKAPALSLHAPKAQSGLVAPDLNINSPGADLKGPDVALQSPEVDASAGKFKLPKIKFPKFGLSGPRVKGPNLDVDSDLKSPDMDLSLADINTKLPEADLTAPDVNLKATDLSLSAPKIKGDFNTSDLDLDADLKTDLDLSAPKTNIGLPDLSFSTITAPEGDLKLPTADVKGSGLDLPKASGLNLKAPNLNLSTPKIDGNLSAPNIDTKLPKAELEAPDATLKAPDVEVNLPKADLQRPDAQLKTPDLGFDSHLGDFKLPHFKVPELGLSSPEVEVPSVDPSVEAGIEAPGVNIGNAADANISVAAPDLSLPKVKGDIKGQEIDVKAPNVDTNVEKPKLPYFKLPKFGFSGSKIKASQVNTSADLDVKVPSVEGGISSPDVSVSSPEGKRSLNTTEVDFAADADAEVKGSPKSKMRWPFKWGLKSGLGSDEEGSGVDSETELSNAEEEVPVFKVHRLPRNSIDAMGGIGDTFGLSRFETETKDYVISKGIRLPVVNTTTKTGDKIDILERLKMAKEKAPSANVSPTEAKTDIDLKLPETGDSSLVRGGTFKVEKPESTLGLVSPEITTSDENDKLSLSLSNMLGLNVKDSDGE